MDPKYEDPFDLASGDTMAKLEALAHAPGELRFRITLVQAIKDLRREVALLAKILSGRLDKLEQRKLIGEVRVAQIAQAEIRSSATIATMRADVRRLWKGAMWLVVALSGAGVGGALHAWWIK